MWFAFPARLTAVQKMSKQHQANSIVGQRWRTISSGSQCAVKCDEGIGHQGARTVICISRTAKGVLSSYVRVCVCVRESVCCFPLPLLVLMAVLVSLSYRTVVLIFSLLLLCGGGGGGGGGQA